MKKKLFFALSFIFFFQISNSFSQFYIGADAGYFGTAIINQNNYGFSELDYVYTAAPSFGASIGYAGLNKHHIQTGIKFIKLGQNYSSTFQSVKHTKEVELNYLVIPLVYKMILGDTQDDVFGTRAFFTIGGYYSSLSSADVIWLLDDNKVPLVTFQESQNRNIDILKIAQLAGGNDLEDDINLFENSDLGITASFGVRTFLSKGLAFNFELIANYGLVDINAEAWRLNNGSGVYTASNNAFGGVQLGLQYYFGSYE